MMVLTLLGPASAQSVSVSEATASVTTTNWGVAPAATGSAVQNTPLLVVWTTQANNAFSYFEAVNTGGEVLQEFTLIMESVGLVPKPEKATLTFQVCDGGSWNLGDNTCSGQIVDLISYDGPNTVSILVSQPIAVGQVIGFRVTTQSNRQDDLTTNLSFSASRAGVRSPLVLDS